MNILDELKKIGWFPNRKIEFDKYNTIDVPLKIRTFIENFGKLDYINKHIIYIFFKKTNKIIVNNFEQYVIGSIYGHIMGNLKITITENEEFYILDYNRKIANSIEDFFYKMFSNSLDISMKFSERFFDEMKNAGWYPNRKVDISNFINTLKDNNYVFFDAIIDFYSEYYNLQGKTLNNNYNWKILDENDILEYYKKYEDYLKSLSYVNYTIQNIPIFPICIMEFEDDMTEYYITEDKRVFTHHSELVGNNFLEGLNSILRL